ncbi:MAG: hypothetical protein ABIP11_07940 [Luteimonas sp.]
MDTATPGDVFAAIRDLVAGLRLADRATIMAALEMAQLTGDESRPCA